MTVDALVAAAVFGRVSLIMANKLIVSTAALLLPWYHAAAIGLANEPLPIAPFVSKDDGRLLHSRIAHSQPHDSGRSAMVYQPIAAMAVMAPQTLHAMVSVITDRPR